MKKRLCSALLAFSLLFLASCGHRQTVGDGGAATEPPQMEPTEQTEVTEPTEPTEQAEPVSAAVPDYSTAEALRRPEHEWLYYDSDPLCDKDGGVSLEDQVHETADATLYIGDGYSIYILMDEWVYQSGTMGGLPADIWTNALDGEEAELRIVKMDSKDFSKAQAWVREQYPDYVLYEDCEGGLGGTDLPYPNATQYIDAYFALSGENMYAVIRTQPKEAKHGERFLCQMKAMIHTFRPFLDFPTAEELGRPEHMQLSCGADAREAERAKAMLDAMADTFKQFKNKVSYNLMHL